MTTTINAAATTGLAISSDGSGVMKLQSNGVTTNALAWVNFNGSTAAIRSSYNVGSVTRNGTGDYTVNFASALSDANYAATTTLSNTGGSTPVVVISSSTAPTTSALRVSAGDATSAKDPTYVCISVFGN